MVVRNQSGRRNRSGKQNAWQYGEGWAHIESRSVRSCSTGGSRGGTKCNGVSRSSLERLRIVCGLHGLVGNTVEDLLGWRLVVTSAALRRSASWSLSQRHSSRFNSIEGYWYNSPKTCRELHHRHCQKPLWP
jgi:hypothetical protein